MAHIFPRRSADLNQHPSAGNYISCWVPQMGIFHGKPALTIKNPNITFHYSKLSIIITP